IFKCDWSSVVCSSDLMPGQPLQPTALVHEAWLRLAIFASEAQPGFMDQRGRLQGLARHLVGHFVRRELAEFLINERKQFPGGLEIGRAYCRVSGGADE